MPVSRGAFLLLSIVCLSAQAIQPEVFSVAGKAYYGKPDKDKSIEKADEQLAKGPVTAELVLAAAAARDTLMRFNDAISVYGRGMDLYQDDVRFPLYRGHRFISLRRFDFAITDLKKASGIAPASFDVSYHLGLAYYLRGYYTHAAYEYKRCMAMAAQPKPAFLKGLPDGWKACYGMDADSMAAMTDWYWAALRRASKSEDAAKVLQSANATTSAGEGSGYYRLLLFYKGALTEGELKTSTAPASATTIGYGVGLLHWLEGRKDRACELWMGVLQDPNWAAFGLIAAEMEIGRGNCKTAAN